uniref:Elongation factor EFG domain-containing protein n=1 Tax=Cucumis melo TaxID=3656 RepID=A0A9I9EKF6_CUCME
MFKVELEVLKREITYVMLHIRPFYGAHSSSPINANAESRPFLSYQLLLPLLSFSESFHVMYSMVFCTLGWVKVSFYPRDYILLLKSEFHLTAYVSSYPPGLTSEIGDLRIITFELKFIPINTSGGPRFVIIRRFGVSEGLKEVPINLEVRRRIAFFTNSLFMDMPHAPREQEAALRSILDVVMQFQDALTLGRMIAHLCNSMFKTENSTKLEPIEEVTIKVNEEHVGLVIEALSHRRAKVTRWVQFEAALAELDCGLVGCRSVFSSDTCGTGFMHLAFLSPFSSDVGMYSSFSYGGDYITHGSNTRHGFSFSFGCVVNFLVFDRWVKTKMELISYLALASEIFG